MPKEYILEHNKMALVTLNMFVFLQPGLCEPSWSDQEVWPHVLQAVLPQQRQGHRLHQGTRQNLPASARFPGLR